MQLSTAQVANLVGVHKRTLLGWLYAGKIREPRRHTGGGQDLRLWSEPDVQRVRRYKELNYRKGRGRKKRH
ncbi:MAG: MerR family transcriptional regulator [Acidobacteriia bacterium]|nr:MerR family transcriptional regulator [Terriglobia bacterium]